MSNDLNGCYFVFTNSPDSEFHLLAIYSDQADLKAIRAEWEPRYGGYYQIRKGIWSGEGRLPDYGELTYVTRS
jgi:hypothetical protein